MKVEILYFEGCPNHRPTVGRVREVADALGVDADITERDVSSVDDPASLGCRGSVGLSRTVQGYVRPS